MDYTSILSWIHKSYSYTEYREKISKLISTNACSGEQQSVEKIGVTRLNEYRMNRVEKQTRINAELEAILESKQCEMAWVILVESWCGDAAQNLPIIAKIADMASIDLKIIFRDDNSEIMNQYLTNGGESIPKLICFDKGTGKEIGTWGPRPVRIKSMVKQHKKRHPEDTHESLLSNLHLWYGRDRGKAIQKDFMNLLQLWFGLCGKTLQYEY